MNVEPVGEYVEDQDGVSTVLQTKQEIKQVNISTAYLI